MLPCTGLVRDVSKAIRERKGRATLGHQALVGLRYRSSYLTSLKAYVRKVDPQAVVNPCQVYLCHHVEFALGHILANHVAVPMNIQAPI